MKKWAATWVSFLLFSFVNFIDFVKYFRRFRRFHQVLRGGGHFFGRLFCEFFRTSLRGWGGAGGGCGFGVQVWGHGTKGWRAMSCDKDTKDKAQGRVGAGCSVPRPVGLAPVDFAMPGQRKFFSQQLEI